MDKKVADLEKLVHEMAEKIVRLENKVKEIETKESEGINMKEAPKQIEECEKVSKKKEEKIKT